MELSFGEISSQSSSFLRKSKESSRRSLKGRAFPMFCMNFVCLADCASMLKQRGVRFFQVARWSEEYFAICQERELRCMRQEQWPSTLATSCRGKLHGLLRKAIPPDPAIPALDIYPTRRKSICQNDTYIPILAAALFIRKRKWR